jgi:hypothetical protein
MNTSLWLISNRQPWVEALMRGWISCKTRSIFVNLPPVNSIVFLHASKALWSGWQDLYWTEGLDVKNLPRGGVIGVTRVVAVGLTRDILTRVEGLWWQLRAGRNCADEQTIRVAKPVAIPFFPCRGSLVPTRKLPIGLWEAPGVQEAIKSLLDISL